MNDFEVLVNEFIKNAEKQIIKINNIIDFTEDFYGSIAEDLPRLEQKINDTIEETKLLVSYFIEIDNFADNNEYIMTEIIDDLKEGIEQVYSILPNDNSVRDKLSGFLTNSRGNENFSYIFDLLKNLRKVLNNLQHLSINAGIYSFKLGSRGRGFQIITDEINKLTVKARKNYEFIRENVFILQEWHQNFFSNIEKLLEEENKLKEVYYIKINKNLKEIIISLKKVAEIMNDLLAKLEWAVSPVFEILLLVQNQDIIRQNMENVTKILIQTIAVLKEKKQKDLSATEIVNLVAFIEDVSHLSVELMKNIDRELQGSLYTIQGYFTEMTDNLKDLRCDNWVLTDFLAGKVNEKGDKVSLNLIYKELVETVPEFKKELINLQKRYEDILNNNNVFMPKMDNINKEFTVINKISTKLNRLRVMARVENSRINKNEKVIEQIKQALDDFTITGNKQQQFFNDLEKNLINNYKQFLVMTEDNKVEIADSIKYIEETQEKVFLSKKLIKDAVRGLKENINCLIPRIEKANEQINKGKDYKNEVENIRKFFVEIKDKAVLLKGKILNENKIFNWQYSNDHLDKLTDQFTSYLERKTVSDEFEGLSFDEGSREGELILF
ncbi:MAG: hypothetical protein ACOCQ2_02795 [Halanaerobiales bacterium]